MNMKMEHISQYLNKPVGEPKPQTLARRTGKKTRFFIDNELLMLGYAAKYRKMSLIDVYCVLARHANAKSQMCFPSYETIMHLSGVKNRNAVVKALKKLEELNIVRIFHSKGRHSNKYLLQDVSVWKKEEGITSDTVKPYQTYHGIDRF